MRFVHTADWHLGKQLHGQSLLEDQAVFLDQFVHYVCEENPDCVIIAGDLYDRAIPAVDAIRLLDETFSRLIRDYGKPMFVITGNHDSAQRVCFAADVLKKSGLYLFGHTKESFLAPLCLDDDWGPVSIHPIPFIEPTHARHLFNTDSIRNHADAIEAVLARQEPSKRSLAIAHVFLTGGSESESERPLSIGGSAEVPASLFNAYSYVALGHLHRPQSILRDSIRYSGSPLKYSFSEIHHKKTVSAVELDAHGDVQIEEVSFTPRKDLRLVRGYFDELISGEIPLGDTNDYILVELLDTSPILDAMTRLRDVLPHVLHLRKPELILPEGERTAPDLSRRNDLEYFDEFFSYVTGSALDDLQRKHMQALLEELARKEREQ